MTSPAAGGDTADAIAAAGSAGAGSDSASVRSQRSNASELAAAIGNMDLAAGAGRAGVTATGDAGSRMGSRATSRGPSPPGSPSQNAALALGGTGSPVAAGTSSSPHGSDQDESSAGQCRCAATNRCFRVMGRVRSDETDRARTLLNLRLRIQEPDGTNRTVEFEFDLTHDTVGSVASEMVSDLELSPEDADAITVAMKREILKLSASMEGEASKNLKTAAAVLQAGLMENALLQANSTTLQDDEDTIRTEEGVEIDSAISGGVAAAGNNVGGGSYDCCEKEKDDVVHKENSVLLMHTLSNASSYHPSAPQQHQLPPATIPQSASEASFQENWEEPSHQLRSACSASSLHSEASAHSAHSNQSNHSIQSSPAQLAVPNDTLKNSSAGSGNGVGNGGSNTAAAAAAASTCPPQANMRLTRTVSMDRQFSSISGNSNNNSNGITNGGYGSGDRFSLERNLSAGALSPGSGVLSPVSSNGNPDKRSLSKLFENLQEVAYEREQCVTPPPVLSTQRPPLPPSVTVGGGNNSGGRLPQTRSSPPGMFAAMLASMNGTSGDRDGVVSGIGNGVYGGPVQNLSEGLLLSANNGINNGGGSTGTLSHPGSVDGDAMLGSTTTTAAGLPGGNGFIGAGGQRLVAKGALFKDKETLRKQAADAMKAVELRSLTLLEGSSDGFKNTRGTPMLATKQNGSCASLTSAIGNNSGGGGGAESGAASAASAAAAAAVAEQVAAEQPAAEAS
jgi:Oxidative-stress-responsive kinase 1 C-terminal domain